MIPELSLEQVMSSLRGDQALDVDELIEIRAYEIGEMGGARLCFSDATPLSDDLIVFTASAEVDEESAADGEIRGSVVGTIDAAGSVQRLRTIDRRWKVEGVHAAHRHRRDRLLLRLRPGRRRRAIPAAQRDDADRVGLRTDDRRIRPMSFPATRMRRLRRTRALRDLVRETELSPRHLIQPLFVVAGEGVREPVQSMPGIERFSINEVVAEATELQAAGIGAVILFGVPASKDERCLRRL